jgi:hypothetical protein
MSVVAFILELRTRKGHQMEKTFSEIVNEIEAIVKAESSNLAVAYAKLWGIATAHLTKEQVERILENRKVD